MKASETQAVQINTLEIENVKRVKAVKIECADNALTVIGGRNGQGKTTVLDSIAYALGGERFRPSNVKRDDSLANPEIKITLSNGLIAERKGKNSSLKVTDPEGKTGGQQLLNQFISNFALDQPRFFNATPKEKAEILLQVIGVGDELKKLESEYQKAYSERHAFGQIADQKRKYADELPYYSDAPEAPVTATELIKSQQDILAKNGENQRKRNMVQKIKSEYEATVQEHTRIQKEQAKLFDKLNSLRDDLLVAEKTAEQLLDESTEEIEVKLGEIDAINVQVRSNMDKERANEEAYEHQQKYAAITDQINKIRDDKMALLDGANLPLPGLSVDEGNLTYNGKAWDCMSGSEQLRVSTAIVRHLNPQCGFVLIDKIETLDVPTLEEFGVWLQEEGLQAITTRVSQGDECSIIIEDGFSVEAGKKNFVLGEF